MVTLDNNSDTSLLGLNNNYENKEASKKLELTNKAANGDDTKVHKNPRKELFKDYASDRKSSLTEVNETNLQKRLESEERLKACEKDKTSEVTTKEANNSKDESKSSEIDDLIKKYCPKLSEKSQSSDEKALVTNLGASSDSPKADVIKIAPIPGICVKSKKSDGEKVFINICKHTEIPPPVIPMTEEKLKTIIEKQVTTSLFSVPMHFGTVRIEQDKSGGKCVACDVIINYKWSDEVMSKSTTFTTFVVHVAMEGLVDQEGNKITLDRENWTILKNKKYLGNIQQQDVCLERFKPMESIKDTERQINEVAKKVAEMKKMKNEDDQTCLFCKIPYVSKKEYVEHVNELHRDEVQSCIDNDKDVPWCVCEYCRIYLPSKETLNKHTYAVHGVKRAESEEIERLLDAEDEVANIVTSKYFKPDIEKTPSSNEIPTKEEEAPKELTPAKPKNIAQESDTSKQNDSNETNNKEWQLKIDFIIKSYFMNKENKTNNQKDKENVNVDEDAPSKETTLSTSDFMKLEILFALCGKSIMQAFRGSTKQPLPNNCPLCLDLKTNFTTQSPMSYLYHVHQKHLDHIKKNKNWRECGACQTYLPSMEVSRHHFKLAHKQQDVYFKPQATDSNNGQNNNFISSRTDDQRLLEIINKSYNNESKRLTKIFGPLDDKSNSSKKGSNSQKKDIKGEQNDGKGPTETGSEDKSKNMQNDTELGEHLENLDREYSGDTDRREKIKKRLIKVYKLVRALADEQITISETQLNTLRNIDETDDDIADYLMSHFQKKIEEKQKERDPLGLALDKASHESVEEKETHDSSTKDGGSAIENPPFIQTVKAREPGNNVGDNIPSVQASQSNEINKSGADSTELVEENKEKEKTDETKKSDSRDVDTSAKQTCSKGRKDNASEDKMESEMIETKIDPFSEHYDPWENDVKTSEDFSEMIINASEPKTQYDSKSGTKETLQAIILANKVESPKGTDDGVYIRRPRNPANIETDVSLPEGWKKEVVMRQKGATAGTYDMYIYAPNGKKFRSRNELRRYCDAYPEMMAGIDPEAIYSQAGVRPPRAEFDFEVVENNNSATEDNPGNDSENSAVKDGMKIVSEKDGPNPVGADSKDSKGAVCDKSTEQNQPENSLSILKTVLNPQSPNPASQKSESSKSESSNIESSVKQSAKISQGCTKSSPILPLPKPISEIKLICKVCEKASLNHGGHRQHIVSKHFKGYWTELKPDQTGKFPCNHSDCKYVSNSKSTFMIHLAFKHSELKVFLGKDNKDPNLADPDVVNDGRKTFNPENRRSRLESGAKLSNAARQSAIAEELKKKEEDEKKRKEQEERRKRKEEEQKSILSLFKDADTGGEVRINELTGEVEVTFENERYSEEETSFISNLPKCTNCGLAQHKGREKCPARDTKCSNCDVIGHFSAQCFL